MAMHVTLTLALSWTLWTVLAETSPCSGGVGSGQCGLGDGSASVVPAHLAANGVLHVMDIDTAHRARFAIMSQLLFPTRKDAETALVDLQHRYKSFKQFADELNRRAGLARQPAVSGDMGLVAYDDVEPEVAKLAFDVRQPLTIHDGRIHGPVCVPDKGCYLFAVFNRFRKEFFSDAWYDVEAFTKREGMNFGEFVDGVNNDAAKHMAWVIWPQEDVIGRKYKIEQLKGDIQRISKQDWSAQPEVESKLARVHRLLSQDLTAHNKLMEEKERIYRRIPADTFAEHPEIYGMSVEDILEAGFVTLPEPSEPRIIGPIELEPIPQPSAQPDDF